MLARVTSGQSGIVQYLKDGVKSDRELTRDELDQRITIDGNIEITDSLIENLNADGRKENYLHITLSFGERELEQDKIIAAYNDYKESVMNAYGTDEYNVYAEIHYPKVKSYTDKKTGDQVERFPHVHMVIPKTNLLTDKSLNPFGKYTDNIKYHDAIQENINRKHGLESPYDNQRKYGVIDNSDFISRYKGDNFKGSNAELKNELFELINNKNIRTMDVFKDELSKYGTVTTGKAGSNDEYLQLKLHGVNKNIRLKESCFKNDYITDRELLRPKPTNQEIQKNLKNWIDTRSHEMKHIHPASPKTRTEYYNLKVAEKEEFLHDRRDEFTRRFGNDRANSRTARNRSPDRIDNFQQGGRATDREFSVKRNGGRGFTDITNGLPDMPQRNVVSRRNREETTTESVLSSDAIGNLEQGKTDRDNELRWSTNRGGRTRGRLIKVSSPGTKAEQLLIEENNKKIELSHFREIRQNLDPKRVLNHLEKTHGLVKGNYGIAKAKDGTPRITVNNKSFNVSDFCTKHMHLTWDDTKNILKSEYKRQQSIELKRIDLSNKGLKHFSSVKSGLTESNIYPPNHFKKLDKVNKENREINSIVFVSNYVTQRGQTLNDKQNLELSVRTLKHLQLKERHGDSKMAIKDILEKRVLPDKNIISNPEIDLKTIKDNFKRQQEMIARLRLKMGDLVPAKDFANGKVDFNDKNTGKSVFEDNGNHIKMASRKPDIEHVAVAMTFAAEKFGKVEIKGTKEFKQQVIDVAVAKDLNIVFASKSMQKKFMEERAIFKGKNEDALSNENTVNKATSNTNEAANSSSLTPTKVVDHGSAPFENNPKNSQSYFVKTANGETHWGVGLKDAIKDANVKNGDSVTINRTGVKPVEVDVPILNSDGAKIGTEKKNVERVNWEIKKHVDENNQKQVDITNKPTENKEDLTVDNRQNDKSVKLVDFGAAPKNNDARNSDSYFMKTSDGKEYWDSNLEQAIKNGNLKKGDEIVINRTDAKKEQVEVPILDKAGNKIGSKPALSERFNWDIKTAQEVKAQAIDKKLSKAMGDEVTTTIHSKENVKVEYKWNEDIKKMEFTVNGVKPLKKPYEQIAAIAKNDKFLSNYSPSELMSGKLDLSKSNGVQPVNREFNSQGVPVESFVQKNVPKNTQ